MRKDRDLIWDPYLDNYSEMSLTTVAHIGAKRIAAAIMENFDDIDEANKIWRDYENEWDTISVYLNKKDTSQIDYEYCGSVYAYLLRINPEFALDLALMNRRRKERIFNQSYRHISPEYITMVAKTLVILAGRHDNEDALILLKGLFSIRKKYKSYIDIIDKYDGDVEWLYYLVKNNFDNTNEYIDEFMTYLVYKSQELKLKIENEKSMLLANEIALARESLSNNTERLV